MEDNIHKGHRERLRNIIVANDICSLPDHKILEFLLFYAVPYKDTNVIAHELIKRFGSFSAVLDAPIDDLASVKNMTKNGAVLLHSLPGIFTKYSTRKQDEEYIKSKDILRYIANIMRHLVKENLYVFCLDNKSRLINGICLAERDTSISISVKEVVKSALNCNCYGVILAHTHPSGDPTPSKNDIDSTVKLIQALDNIGVMLVDHIIVTKNHAYSFVEQKIFNIDTDDLVVNYGSLFSSPK